MAYFCYPYNYHRVLKERKIHVINKSINLNFARFIPDPPENVRITPENDIFYSRRGGTPYVDVVCEADCLPPCSYTWYYASSRWFPYSFTRGNTLFAQWKFNDVRYNNFFCKAENFLHSSNSEWITVNVKGRFLKI